MGIIFTSSSAASFKRAVAGAAGILAVCSAVLPRSASPRFFPDDPLWTDNDRVMDASKVTPIEDSNSYDFIVNTLGHPGERRDVRAGATGREEHGQKAESAEPYHGLIVIDGY